MRLIIISVAALALAGCATTGQPTRVETVEVIKEVQVPCPAQRPARPAPLGPLPADLETLAALLAAKVKEYAGPGAYADQADAIMARCTQQP